MFIKGPHVGLGTRNWDFCAKWSKTPKCTKPIPYHTIRTHCNLLVFVLVVLNMFWQITWQSVYTHLMIIALFEENMSFTFFKHFLNQ
jgi:hypothetical protein